MLARAMKQLRVVNLNELVHHELSSSSTGESFSLSAVVTDALQIGSMFIHHDIIPPGRRASGAHRHTTRDEVVVVLSGRVRAWHAGAEVVLHEGDALALPAASDDDHYIANDGTNAAVILVIAPSAPEDVVLSHG